MKTLTVRLPEALVAEIEAESSRRQRSKSDVVRERLSVGTTPHAPSAAFKGIADLVGSVHGLPVDLSRRKKSYLKNTGYGGADETATLDLNAGPDAWWRLCGGAKFTP